MKDAALLVSNKTLWRSLPPLNQKAIQGWGTRHCRRSLYRVARTSVQVRAEAGMVSGGSWPPTLESEGDSRMGHPARHGCLGMPDQGASTTFRKTYSISSIERKYLAKRIWIGTLKSACGVFFASWIWFRASARQSGQNAVVSLRGHRKQPQIFRLRCAPLKMTTALWLCLNHRQLVSNAFSGLGKDWLQGKPKPQFWCATGPDDCLGLNLPIDS